jgi:hypothetical protein
MASRVADAEKHGPVLRLGTREGLVTPWVPIDRIVSVLTQVRAGFVDEPIRVFGHRGSFL